MTPAESAPNKQVASAVGEGATAALMIRNYLENQQRNRGYRGLIPFGIGIDRRIRKSVREKCSGTTTPCHYTLKFGPRLPARRV